MSTPTPEQPTLSLKERQQLLVAAQVIKDWSDEQVKALRASLQEDFLAINQASGSKSFDIKVEGLGKVASMSLRESSDAVQVVDEAGFVAYVENNYEGEVDYVPTVRAAFRKKFLEKDVKGVFHGDGAGQVIDPTTGEVVPGLKAVKGGAVTGLSGLTGFSADSKVAVLDLLRDRTLQAAIEGTPVEPVADDRVVEGEVVEPQPETQPTAEEIGRMKRPELRTRLDAATKGADDLVGSLPQLRKRLIDALGLQA